MTHCWHIVRFAKSLRISQRISAFARCAKANIACSRPHMSLRIMCCHPPFRKREHDAAAGCSFACTLRWHWRCLRCCRLPSEACSESDFADWLPCRRHIAGRSPVPLSQRAGAAVAVQHDCGGCYGCSAVCRASLGRWRQQAVCVLLFVLPNFAAE